ncbi:sialate O-acetylesterase [Pseudoflavitalea sp. X16]|uniref:sialate O-acetylesterase n=1 Tax=Paraflavitalea devenefica TaxID=2716334 RepID=UPI00141FCEFB|nr:sialate O-acetylesterase [Paraflavitalea devenefica]NII26505.1 sialate O-acetylesterase [Paraflavitalea devenefica]
MKRTYRKKLLSFFVACSPLLSLVYGQTAIRPALSLPQLVRDSMVLQRDANTRIWGRAAAGEKVTVRFNNKTYRTTTGNDGKWQVQLAPAKAGGPYTMQIDASQHHLMLKDILIGDVWICSGQSNMVHQMILHRERYEKEIAAANYPQIRHFWIPTMTDLQGPHDDLPTGYWKTANPQDVLQFSAVAYFFARKLYEQYKVPIGLINASVGGTPIQAWTSEEGLAAFPAIAATITQNKDTAHTNGLIRAMQAFNNSRPKQEDKGLTGAVPWYAISYQSKGWRSINVPGYWEDQGIRDLDGVVWYRKEIDVPAAMAQLPAKIALGRIIDADELYVNGKQVGRTTYQYPQRRYLLPAGVLQPGKNLLVVRVTNQSGKGGFVPDKPYYLSAGQDTIDLKGTWQYRVGDVFIPQRFNGVSFSAQNSPTALYNAMLAPATPYTIKGFLWYQGEANTGNAREYAALMPALIKDWRTKWGQGDLPFLYVQLPNYMDVQYLPMESHWAATREAQLKALSVPNTGMAVAIDLGEWNDIHPDNKKDVGERLSLLADQLVYGNKNIVASGPLYDTVLIEGNKMKIRFHHVGGGLITNDGEAPGEFAIAGADKKFVWAKAKIEGDQVIVWNDAIAQPLYVRYAWADNPANPNLYNREGLPASPFRTDQ